MSLMAKEFIEIVEAQYRLLHMAYEGQALDMLRKFVLDQSTKTSIASDDPFVRGFVEGWNQCTEEISIDVPDSIGSNDKRAIAAAKRDVGEST